MANSPLKEMFSDVTLTVDAAIFKYTDEVQDIFRGHSNHKSKALSYEAHGSFVEIEDLFVKLSSLERHAPNARHHQGHHSQTQVKPVEVVGAVMKYIEQKCSKELLRIQGEDISIKMNDHSEKVVVTFHNLNQRKDLVHVHFARERFITFYQRIATDLQVKSYSLDPRHYKSLQSEFPDLLISSSSSKQKVTVIGHYVSIAKLEDFLSKSSSGRQRPVTPKASDGASGTSAAHNKQPDKEETCAICMDPIEETERKTLECKHSFCRDCLQTAFKFKPVCPTCGKLYGELKGTQPEGGTMSVNKERTCLPEYEKYGTIVISYYIPNGIQKEGHPNPGQRYEGVSRNAYLPDSLEGRKVLELLKRAFNQRLIFTIGRSSTSGRNNVVTWNDIHHKTSRLGGATCYGYPDPHYLDRVQDELKVKGIY